MATFVSEEASAINCPACLSPYQVPKLLPCLHTFCQKCLQRCSEELEDKEGKKIKCPLCRSECDVPTGGVDGFLDEVELMAFWTIYLFQLLMRKNLMKFYHVACVLRRTLLFHNVSNAKLLFVQNVLIFTELYFCFVHIK